MIQHTLEKRLINNVLGVQSLIAIHFTKFGSNCYAESHKLIVRRRFLVAVVSIVVVVVVNVTVVIVIINVMPTKTSPRTLRVNIWTSRMRVCHR